MTRGQSVCYVLGWGNPGPFLVLGNSLRSHYLFLLSVEDYNLLRKAIREDDMSADELLAKAQEGWSLADDFFRSIKSDSDTLPFETRSWKEVYEEAKDEHFREKGMLQ